MTSDLPTQSSQGLLVVLSGPSGVGKGTVVAAAMARRTKAARRLKRSVSVTTRPRRPDERDRKDYFFCTPEEFGSKVRAGELLEWATYLDHSYGTPAGWVDEQLQAGFDVVLEIEVQGAMQVKKQRPDAVLIYMCPPSWEALRRRLAKRRSESLEVQRRRLAVAKQEIQQLREYDYVVVNGKVAEAALTFMAILEAEHARVDRHEIAPLQKVKRG
ncbi:MAG: guanylate kinase [Armatimonadetes bacterium]|nr:guanylate kinase [Armatimonadota bacterium]